jgi:hypothetical protein
MWLGFFFHAASVAQLPGRAATEPEPRQSTA